MSKLYFVTGGTRGIGREIVYSLSKNEDKVVFVYQKEDLSAKKISEETGALGIKCDVRDYTNLKIAAKSGRTYFGKKSYDGIVTCAGISKYALINKMSEEDIKNIIDINLTGAINSVKAVVDEMISVKYGKIIMISSIWGNSGSALESIYSASKHGVTGFAKSLAAELIYSNIRVNTVSPGPIDTDMLDELKEEDLKLLRSKSLDSRIGTPKDIANLVEFLFSSKGDFITGQDIVIDGGFTL